MCIVIVGMRVQIYVLKSHYVVEAYIFKIYKYVKYIYTHTYIHTHTHIYIPNFIHSGRDMHSHIKMAETPRQLNFWMLIWLLNFLWTHWDAKRNVNVSSVFLVRA